MLAFVLSIAAHVFVVCILVNQGAQTNGAGVNTPISGHAISVNLIKQEAVASKSPSSHASAMMFSSEKNSENLPLPSRAVGLSAGPNGDFLILKSPEPYYYQLSELSEKPHVLQDISPVLSLGLLEAKSQTAVLSLLINEQGAVDKALIEDDLLSEPVRQLVKMAFEKIKFEPGKIDNISVKSQLWIEITLEATSAR